MPYVSREGQVTWCLSSSQGSSRYSRPHEVLTKLDQVCCGRPGSALGSESLQSSFIPLVSETFGFTHVESVFWLDRPFEHALAVPDRLLREISWVSQRSSGEITRGASSGSTPISRDFF